MSTTKTPETEHFHDGILNSGEGHAADLVSYYDFACKLEHERGESRKAERLVRAQLAAEREARQVTQDLLRSIYLRAEVGVPLTLLPAEVDEIRRTLNQKGAA